MKVKTTDCFVVNETSKISVMTYWDMCANGYIFGNEFTQKFNQKVTIWRFDTEEDAYKFYNIYSNPFFGKVKL